MAESLANPLNGLPNELHATLYDRWTAFGLVITGNVQVDASYLSTPADVYISNDPRTQDAWRRWATAATQNDTLALVQLSHCGRQSMRGVFRAPWRSTLAPSAVALSEGSFWADLALRLMFGKPAALTTTQLVEVVAQFVAGARVAQQAGFSGVQLHCSHGYLLSSFLSPRTNQRQDEYGGTSENRLRLIFEIIDAIRADCPSAFCVAVKLNSADFIVRNFARAFPGLADLLQSTAA
jgi:2,4-dienoyl-CoA reductase-like NADH-dependent reductase (Old Yellow Enzyme family)